MYSQEAIKRLQTDTLSILKQVASGSDIQIAVDTLRRVLRFHEYRYYVLDEPLISDFEYDTIYKALENIESDHPDLITKDSPTQRVGNSLNAEFLTVPHLVAMLSLENSYSAQDLIDWDKRAQGLINAKAIEYSVEPKFDGASISLIYENDFLIRGATRGNGVEGDDITLNIKQLKSIPLSARFSDYGIQKIEVRGEVLMTKSSFKKYNEMLAEQGLPPLANPRNAASGSLRIKDPAVVKKRNLEAIIYNISYLAVEGGSPGKNVRLPVTHSQTLDMLLNVGFKTPSRQYKVFTKIAEVIAFCDEYEKSRETLPYEIDGMVVKVNQVELQQRMGNTTHHPRWAMAYKFKAKQATSKLLKVEFQVGRTGSVTPVAKIEPVSIAGATVTSVSLFNEDVVREKDLYIGDTVLVERAGDVIPYIVKPLIELRNGNESKIIFPKNCPVCKDELVKPEAEAVWRCVNINCEAQAVERIIHFVSKDAMDIRSFGEANVRKFFDAGLLKNVPGIYTLDFTTIGKMEGFGLKSVDNLTSAIEKSKVQPLNRLIFGLGIRYVGETTAKTLAGTVEYIFDLQKYSLEELQNLPDVGGKVAGSIFYFFSNDDNIAMLKKLEALGVNMSSIKTRRAQGILSGKTFLFTGTLPTIKRSEAEALVEKNGGELLGSVSVKLNFLVVGKDAGSKLDKAKKIKTVAVLDEAEFLKIVQG